MTTPPNVTFNGEGRYLVIVQKNLLVVRAWARYLSPLYSAVFTACNARDAELIFQKLGPEPTDLICGQNFGPEEDTGLQLIRAWRGRHRGLRRVVLATAESNVPTELPGVDAVFHKPNETRTLATMLQQAA